MARSTQTAEFREEAVNHLSKKRVLITGATGSFGSEFTLALLDLGVCSKIVVFSRDELKQAVLEQKFRNHRNYQSLRFMIGDIRDYDRLLDAFQGIDIVVHAAALKRVDTIEYNPFEAVKTNILGAQNVVRASAMCKVQQIIALSTDKASHPGNLYGATKLCQDKLMVAANFMYPGLQASVVRYGNVFGSRGSVLPIFLSQAESGKDITITNAKMTRFSMDCSQAVEFVLRSMALSRGGEIFVPKLESYEVGVFAQALKAVLKRPDLRTVEIGARPGEKMHEHMIASYESSSGCLEFDDMFVLMPPAASFNVEQAVRNHWLAQGGKVTISGFEYASDSNTMMDIEKLQKKILAFLKESGE